MVPHLSKCVLVGPEVRSWALEEINVKKKKRDNPPATIGRSASIPLPAITTGIGHHPGSRSATPFDSPIPSPLLLSAPLLNFERPPKCARVSSFTVAAPPPVEDLQSPTERGLWNSELQQEFGKDFCKLLIATRSSWNTAHNPQMQLFVEKWIPGAIIPDRRTLSGSILD